MGKCIGKAGAAHDGKEEGEEPEEEVEVPKVVDVEVEDVNAAPDGDDNDFNDDDNDNATADVIHSHEEDNFSDLISDGEEFCLNDFSGGGEGKDISENRYNVKKEVYDDVVYAEEVECEEISCDDVMAVNSVDFSTKNMEVLEDSEEEDEFEELRVNVLSLSNDEDSNDVVEGNDDISNRPSVTKRKRSNDLEGRRSSRCEGVKTEEVRGEEEEKVESNIETSAGARNQTENNFKVDVRKESKSFSGGGDIRDILKEINEEHCRNVEKLVEEMKECNQTLSQLIQSQLTVQKKIIDKLCKKRRKTRKKNALRKNKTLAKRKNKVSEMSSVVVEVEEGEGEEQGDIGQIVIQQNQEIKQLMEMVIASVNEQRKQNVSMTSSFCEQILKGQEEIKQLIKEFIDESKHEMKGKTIARVGNIINTPEVQDFSTSQALCSAWLQNTNIDAMSTNTGSKFGFENERHEIRNSKDAYDIGSKNTYENYDIDGKDKHEYYDINGKNRYKDNEINGRNKYKNNEINGGTLDRYDIGERNDFDINNTSYNSLPLLSIRSNEVEHMTSVHKQEIIYTEIIGHESEIITERIERLTQENQRIDNNIIRVIDELHSASIIENEHSFSGEIKDLRDSWIQELGGIKSLHKTTMDERKAEKMEKKRKKKELDDFMKNYLKLR